MLGSETYTYHWNTNGNGQKNLCKNDNLANRRAGNDEPRRLYHNWIADKRRRISAGKYWRRDRDLHNV